MKKKRLFLVLLYLLLFVGVPSVLLFNTYAWQLFFGPKIKGVPLWALQDQFRRSSGLPVKMSWGDALGLWEEDGLGSRMFVGKRPHWARWNHLQLWGRHQDVSRIDQDDEQLLLSLLTDSEAKTRAAVATELGKSSSKQGLDALLKFLDDPEETVREAAAESIPLLDPHAKDALPRIRELLKHSDPSRRALAMQILVDVQGKTKETMDVLLGMFDDPQAKVRSTTAFQLARWGRKRSAQPAVPSLLKRLDDPDAYCRLEVAKALWTIAKKEKEVVTVLKSELKNPDAEIRLKALQFLNEVKNAPAAMFDELVTTARQEQDPEIRSLAVLSLGTCGKRAVPILMTFLDIPDESVKTAATRALGTIGPDAREAAPRLVTQARRALADSDLGQASLEALGRIKSEQTVPGLLALLDGAGREFEIKVIATLGKIGPDAKEAIPRLLPLLDHQDPEIKVAATIALGCMGHAGVVDALIELLDEREPEEPVPRLISEDEFIRLNTVIALGNIGKEASAAAPVLHGLLDFTDVRPELIRAMLKIGVEPETVISALLPRIEERSTDALDAIRSLGQFGVAAKEAIPTLVRLFENDDLEFADAAAEALSKIDPARFAKKKSSP